MCHSKDDKVKEDLMSSNFGVPSDVRLRVVTSVYICVGGQIFVWFYALDATGTYTAIRINLKKWIKINWNW